MLYRFLFITLVVGFSLQGVTHEVVILDHPSNGKRLVMLGDLHEDPKTFSTADAAYFSQADTTFDAIFAAMKQVPGAQLLVEASRNHSGMVEKRAHYEAGFGRSLTSAFMAVAQKKGTLENGVSVKGLQDPDTLDEDLSFIFSPETKTKKEKAAWREKKQKLRKELYAQPGMEEHAQHLPGYHAQCLAPALATLSEGERLNSVTGTNQEVRTVACLEAAPDESTSVVWSGLFHLHRLTKYLTEYAGWQLTQHAQGRDTAVWGPLAVQAITRSQACTVCLKPESALPKGSSLKKCARCHCTTYCGVECQRSGWKSGHKKACAVIAQSFVKQQPAVSASFGGPCKVPPKEKAAAADA